GRGARGRGGGRAGGGAAVWRRGRARATRVAIIRGGGVVIGMLRAGPAGPAPRDPRNVGPAGTHALAALLAGQGKQVSAVDTAAAALARAGRPHTVLVIADPALAGGSSLAALAATSADLLIVAPGRRAL